MWNLKYEPNGMYLQKQKQIQRHREQIVVPRGKEGAGRTDSVFGISRCKLLYIGWINKKVLLRNTRNHIQLPVINHNGKEYKKEYICVCITGSPLYSRN